jgi:stage V sporulation protein SpoVS
VDELTKTDEIAAAIAGAIRKERKVLLTVPQRIGAAALAVLVALPAAEHVLRWFGVGG